MKRRAHRSGSVYQRSGDGRWVMAVTIDGKRHQRYAATEHDALALLAEYEATLPPPQVFLSPAERFRQGFLVPFLPCACQPGIAVAHQELAIGIFSCTRCGQKNPMSAGQRQQYEAVWEHLRC